MNARWTTARGNKRKKPISSRIVNIIGHNYLSLSELFPVLNNSHRLRKKKSPICNDESPIFTQQSLNYKPQAPNYANFHRGEKYVPSWAYNLFIVMKNLSAHDEKASNQNLRAQRPMLRPKKSSQKPMKPTKTERITKYRRPEMRTKQATDGARDGAAETSRLGT